MEVKDPEIPKNKYRLYVLTALSGILAGILNGFVGSGGGIILIFTMTFLFKNLGVKERFATAVSSILPMSVVSVVFYMMKGQMPTENIFRILIPAAVGGPTGAFLMEKTSPSLLRTIFAVLIIYAGIRFVT